MKYAEVVVLTSYVGEHEELMQVYSFGKERGVGRIARIVNYWKLFWMHSRDADAVFFHMIPEFVVAVVPILIFRKCRKALWYVHGSVPIWLRIAEKLVDVIFSVNPASFRLVSKKVMYTGHAIDTEFFRPMPTKFDKIRVMTAGRLSLVKRLEVIREAVSELPDMMFDVIADAPYAKMPEIYNAHDIFVSMSATGSVDKAVLEAMACGLTVITANEAFRDMLPPRYFLDRRDPELLAERIRQLVGESRPNLELRAIVEKHHGMTGTIQKITGRLLS